jgi:hypothetical protein
VKCQALRGEQTNRVAKGFFAALSVARPNTEITEIHRVLCVVALEHRGRGRSLITLLLRAAPSPKRERA